MSTSYSWEGKGRYGSFQLQINMWVCRIRLRSLENMCHTRALLRYCFTKKCYIKCMYLTLPYSDSVLVGKVFVAFIIHNHWDGTLQSLKPLQRSVGTLII